MAGKNLVLQTGEPLFKKGDASDGMYLVRQGELAVYLEQNGREVTLAMVPMGGMIGEMALFDQKPRSASVKATTRTEVTLISNDEFQKLMKQIPKWFTALMTTLSGRLRATNDRLQEIEAKTGEGLRKILSIQRILHVIELLWHRDGAKVGKEWHLEKGPVVKTMTIMFHENPSAINNLIKALVTEKFFESKFNEYKNEVIVTSTRSTLTRLLIFLDEYAAKNPAGPVPAPALHMLAALGTAGESGAYESYTATLADLESIGKKAKMTTIAHWKENLPALENLHEELKVSKSADGSVSLKANKKSIKEIIKFHAIIAKIFDSFSL